MSVTEMQCAFLIEPGRIELRAAPIPHPAEGQVVVRVERALVNSTDSRAFRQGHPQVPMPCPFGHRYSGTIVAMGRGGPDFALGQAVMGVHSAPCLACDLCRKQRWELCRNMLHDLVQGACAQFLCIPATVARQNLFPRPAFLSAQSATLLEPLACVAHGLERLTWKGIDRVLVLGLGTIGLCFAQLLPLYTAAERCGAGRRNLRLDLARRFGLKTVWDVDNLAQTEDLIAAEQFDCVIECTGRPEGWQQAFARAAPGGQVLLFGGLPRGTVFPIDSYRLHDEEIDIKGSYHFAPRDVAQARDFLRSGRLDLEALVSGCWPLTQLPEALRRLEAGEGLQYVIDPWG